MNASSDSTGPSLSFSVTGEGVVVDPVTGAVRIAADRLADGITLTVTATGSGGSVESRFKLTVAALEVPPALVAAPSLAGEAKIGTAIAVDPGTWSGTPVPGLALQWVLDGAEIRGADGASYVPMPGDDGGALACRVTAANAAGAAEATTEALTVSHVPPIAAGGLADLVLDQGAPPTQVAAAADFTGAGLVFSVSGAGATIDSATGLVTIATDALLDDERITVTATNSGGSAASGFRVRVETVVAAPQLLAAPSLAGSGRIDTVVSVDPGSWSGHPAPEITLQWLCDGEAIVGAVGASYTPGPGDDGKVLTCWVTAVNSVSLAEAVTPPLTVTQAPPAVVAALPDLAAEQGDAALKVEAAPAFDGAALVFAVAGARAVIDPATGVVEIPTGTPREAEEVTVSASNSGGTAEVRFAVTITKPLPLPVAPVLVTAPVLAGSAKIGQSLIVEPGVWGGEPAPALAFQWCADGAEIAGATGAAYTPVAADDLKAITCVAKASNVAGSAEAVTAALMVSYVAPVARRLLPEEIFDEGTGDQVVDAAADFEGDNLTFGVTGAGARIDPATGRVTVPTDTPLEDQVTVTAMNSGGAAESSFQVTVEAGEPAEAFPALLSASDVDALYTSPTLREGFLKSSAPVVEGFTYKMSLSPTSGGSTVHATPVAPGGRIERLLDVPDGTTIYGVPFIVRTSDGEVRPALAPSGTTANGHTVRPIPGNESYGEVRFVTGSGKALPLTLTPVSSSALAIAIAADIPQFRNPTQGFGGYGVNTVVGPTLSAMAVASIAGDTSADSRIQQYLDTVLSGASCPSCRGGYFTQMKDAWAISGFACVRYSPIWDGLTTTEKKKITAIVKAAAIGVGFVGSDVRNPPSGATTVPQQLLMDGTTQQAKGGGGNMASGLPSTLLSSIAFFGGPSVLADVFANYDHSDFIAELNSLGLTNITTTWSRPGSPTEAQVEAALAGTWTYWGAPLSNITGILMAPPALGGIGNSGLAKTIRSGLNNGAGASANPSWGKIISGAAGLPNNGVAKSMWYEFDSHDSSGERSSAQYATYTAETYMCAVIALIAGDQWDLEDATLAALMARMNRAMIDYSYKIAPGRGYKSWAHNSTAGIHAGDFGYDYTETSAPGDGPIASKWALQPREELWHTTIAGYLGL